MKKINKELRFKIALINFISPRFKEKGLLRKRRLLELLKGKCSSDLDYEEIFIDRSDVKNKNKLRIVLYSKKAGSKENAPIILWFHGGGYALGIPEMDEKRIKLLIDNTNAIVVSVDYTLSYEKPYPQALNDAYDALKWIKKTDKFTTSKILVGGESAGGGLAIGLALYVRDKKEDDIAFLLPLYPMLDDQMLTKSVQNRRLPIWNGMSNRIAWDLYIKDKTLDLTYAAPLRAASFKGLPPVITYVGTLDPFLDEVKLFVSRLEKDNVKTYFKVFDNVPHAFDALVPNAPISIEASTFLLKTINEFILEEN